MTFKCGDFLTVISKFNSDISGDLSCKKGEKLTVVKINEDQNWITCSNVDHQEGLVPIDHVKLYQLRTLDELWFHGDISRSQAEQRLSNCSDGTFLVRDSNKHPGDFTICVQFQDSVEHYRVFNQNGKYSLDEETWCSSMPELILHYQNAEDGLCCVLGEGLNNVSKSQIGYLKEKGFLINNFDFNLGPKIGSGQFSEVFQGRYQMKKVAVKRLTKKFNIAGESLFTYESSLMSQLSHQNLVSFFGMSVTQNHIYIIIEYMEIGSLDNYLQSRGRAIIKTNDQIRFAIDSCRGMCYLEEHCLVHRDLAARNILLNNDLVAKVSDFGLSKFDNSRLLPNSPNLASHGKGTCQATSSPNHACDVINELASLFSFTFDEKEIGMNQIPVKWTAPEALIDHKYTNKSDVWSFGVLLWEIFSFGRTPYPKIYANDVRNYIMKGYRMACPEHTPANMYDLMMMCWAQQPDMRPDFFEILKILSEL